MGSGKSSTGRKLAHQLRYEYIDTDQLIEEKTGMSITEYFSNYGEEQFRKLEYEVISGLEQRSGVVISTGGGVPLNPQNIASLKKHCTIIWLYAAPEVILKRVGDRNSRPLLRDAEDPLGKIVEMLEKRESVYRNASDTRIDTSTFQQAETIRQIRRWLSDAGWRNANSKSSAG